MSLNQIAPTLPARPDLGHAFLDGILAFIWFLLGLARAVILVGAVALVLLGVIILSLIVWEFIQNQFANHLRRSLLISGVLILAVLYGTGILAIPGVQWAGGVIVSVAITAYVLIKAVRVLTL